MKKQATNLTTATTKRLQGLLGLVAVLAVMFILLPGTVASAPSDDPSDDPHNGSGEWVATSYSASLGNTCSAAAGEVCKEWCVRTPNHQLIPTGELCCVVGNVCLTARPQG